MCTLCVSDPPQNNVPYALKISLWVSDFSSDRVGGVFWGGGWRGAGRDPWLSAKIVLKYL